jgi:hypothetical protein
LPDAIRETAGDRGADGVGHCQRAGHQTTHRIASGRGRHEQEGAELAHGKRQAAEESDDVAGPSEGQHPLV